MRRGWFGSIEQAYEGVCGLLSLAAVGLPHGGEVECGCGGDGVVEADEGEVFGNAEAEASCGVQGPFGKPVAEA